MWRKHPSTIILVLDRFQKYGVIDAAAIIDWTLSEDTIVQFYDAHVRDVLRNAIAWTVRSAHAAQVNYLTFAFR